jgi:hypothetical protein
LVKEKNFEASMVRMSKSKPVNQLNLFKIHYGNRNFWINGQERSVDILINNWVTGSRNGEFDSARLQSLVSVFG